MSLVDALNIVNRIKQNPGLYNLDDDEVVALTIVERAAASNIEAH